MIVFSVTDVNDAYYQGMNFFADKTAPWETQGSRNGSVRVASTPVMTVYKHPRKRVLFDKYRLANPFFHMAEWVWMMNNSNELGWLAHYNKRFNEFSDDGITLYGAYGYRWAFQLDHVIRRLSVNPLDRRVWVSLIEPKDQNMAERTKDLPCNNLLYFRVTKDGTLDMTVVCRSNDMIWGAYGANAVHFSMLQECVALKIGCRLGRMYQFSNNFHVYEKVFEPLASNRDPRGYESLNLVPLPMQEHYLMYDIQNLYTAEHRDFVNGTIWNSIRSGFGRNIMLPMFIAWEMWKAKERERAFTAIEMMPDMNDWRHACTVWLRSKEW